MSKQPTGPFIYSGQITIPARNLSAIRTMRTDNSSDLATALIETLSANRLFAAKGRDVRVTIAVDITVNPDAGSPWCPDAAEGCDGCAICERGRT